MFLRFYGLREQPFGVTPDPAYLYFSATHREALASLFYGIESGCGFLALIAPPGMGKTTLLFHLLEKLRSSAQTVFIFQTQCGPREFFRYLLADLGAETGEQDLARMHELLNAVLLKNARMGRRVVLVIDEAQNLDDSVLETVRLLSDFETARAKLLQIVLCGQPQLATKLSHPGLAQLRQRISIIGRLHPLTRVETMVYIEYRLCKAGYAGPPLFGYEAVELIAAHSEGIPRNINNLCFNALTLGCAKRAKKIDAAIVSEVLADLDLGALGEYPTNAPPEMQGSLSSFDGLSPTDETTYQELHDAVRTAWGAGMETADHEGPQESEPILMPGENGAAQSIDIESSPAADSSETSFDIPEQVSAQTTPMVPVEAEATPAPAVWAEVKEESPTLSQPDPSSSQSDLGHAPEAGNPTEHFERPANANRTFAADSFRLNGAGADVFAILSATVRALTRFLPDNSRRKIAGGSQRRRPVGSGTVAVVALTLVGGCLLAVARHHESAKPSQSEESTAQDPSAASSAPAAAQTSAVDVPRVEQKDDRLPQQEIAPKTSSVVTVESGQTLGEVSLRYLGQSTPKAIQKIQELNPDIKNPDLIFAGKQIRLPEAPNDSHGNTSSSGGDPNPMETLR